MKILLSAYACEPNRGSEPGVGFRTLLAVAQEHEVWLLTRQNNIRSLADRLADHPDRNRIHLEGIDLPGWALWVKKRLGLIGRHWYYDRWQRAAGALAVELDRRVSFDVVHHVTFAAYWMRVGVAPIRKPLVLGPLGGGAETPLRFLPELGWAGVGEEILRVVVRRALAKRRSVRRALGGAAIVFAQNEASAVRMGVASPVVMPNALVVADEIEQKAFNRTPSGEILVVGRLVPWKGGSLAVRALALLDETYSLCFLGDGPDRGRIGRLARRLGVSERVRMAGAVPRAEVIESVASAGVLLHLALHDEAPLGVAEAFALGTPVVCLSGAGPAEIAKYWPSGASRVIHPRGRKDTVAQVAHAIEELLSQSNQVDIDSPTPFTGFGERILAAYAQVVRQDRKSDGGS